MGELDEAIRDHLELKRRRGADPAEVAREEQDALAPVTRGHPVVIPAPAEHEHDAEEEHDERPSRNDEAARHADATERPHDESPGDSTQEFRVELAEDDWLADDEDA